MLGGVVARAMAARGGGASLAHAFRRCTSTSAALGVAAATARRAVAASVPVEVLPSSSGLLGNALRHYGLCYWELSKARLSMLVVSTAGVGFVMGSGEVVEWTALAWTAAGTMMAAASANAFNQVIEVSSDARMKRTMRRPLPSGRLSVPHALVWAAGVGATGIALLACKTNVLTATLGAANVALYTLAYTPLKQIHPVNTWVGAVVGAIPPLMGWAAASGKLDPSSWLLASALYFWQIPHFMALAYMCRNDYAAGGYKMLSLFDVSGRRTALAAVRNCVYLLPLGFVAYYLGTTSKYFAVETCLLTAGMGVFATHFYLHPSSQTARKLFLSSLLYLPLFMASMVVHRLPNQTRDSLMMAQADATLGANNELDYETSADGRKQKEQHKISRASSMQQRPPIALVSVAPFPLLPFPDSPAYRT